MWHLIYVSEPILALPHRFLTPHIIIVIGYMSSRQSLIVYDE